jgi:ribonuclease Y
MEIIGAAALIAVGIVAAAVLYGRTHGGRTATALASQAASSAALDAELPERAAALARRESELARRESELELERSVVADGRHELERALERVSGLSPARAKQMLLKEIEDQARHDAARLIRQIEEETKRDADRRVRNILSVCMQRLAAGHAAETTVSVVQLSADDMKGRIIGREGRNIRALENLTGVDFIIDDTPGAVVLSGFDGVRREIARMTLEKLLQDGRIHPARIEEMYYQAKSELESHMVQIGEQGVFDAGVQVPHELRSERARTLDRGLSAGGNDGRGTRRRPDDSPPRGVAARHRQGRHARDRGPARAGRRRAGSQVRRARGGGTRDGGASQRG